MGRKHSALNDVELQTLFIRVRAIVSVHVK